MLSPSRLRTVMGMPLACATLLLILTAAQTASAANVLFTGSLGQYQPFVRVWDSITANAPGVLQTTPGPVPGFTIPSQTFTGMYTATATFPGYPYFSVYGNLGKNEMDVFASPRTGRLQGEFNPAMNIHVIGGYLIWGGQDR